MTIKSNPAALPHQQTLSPKNWSFQEIHKLQIAVDRYNNDHPAAPFPEHPFGEKFSFTKFTKQYLQNFSRDAKQIRERCINNFYSKAVGTVPDADIDTVKKIYNKYVLKRSATPWADTSSELFKANNQEFYYTANALKNTVSNKGKYTLAKRKLSFKVLEVSKEQKGVRPFFLRVFYWAFFSLTFQLFFRAF